MSIRDYATSRPLLLMWFAYLFWNCSIGGLGNLSLYARQALGRDPKDFSGLMMALRFGCKSLGGYMLGAIALRRGLRASALAAIADSRSNMLSSYASTVAARRRRRYDPRHMPAPIEDQAVAKAALAA